MLVIDFIVLTEALPADFETTLRKSLTGFSGPARVSPVKGYPHITRAYNAAAKSSTQDILCFVHDDVRFAFNLPQFLNALEIVKTSGIVGVCGATRLEDDGTWWRTLSRPEINACCRGAVGSPNGMLRWNGFGQVVVVDGVLLMLRRAVFDALGGFDERLTGAHFYDVDISLRSHRAGLMNRVVDLPVFHNSTGNYNAVWEECRKQFLALTPSCRERLAG
jgi:GT2 family glycosyltransferase